LPVGCDRGLSLGLRWEAPPDGEVLGGRMSESVPSENRFGQDCRHFEFARGRFQANRRFEGLELGRITITAVLRPNGSNHPEWRRVDS